MAAKVVNVENLTEQERGRLMTALKEMSSSLARAEGERTYVSEATKKVSEDLKLPKKVVSKLVKVFHKQNFDQEVAEHEEFEKFYKAVVK